MAKMGRPKSENAKKKTLSIRVEDAFEMLYEEQKESGWNDAEIDGMTGFIFYNRFGNVSNPQSVNRAIKRIIADYNTGEEVKVIQSPADTHPFAIDCTVCYT